MTTTSFTDECTCPFSQCDEFVGIVARPANFLSPPISLKFYQFITMPLILRKNISISHIIPRVMKDMTGLARSYSEKPKLSSPTSIGRI